MTRKNYHLKIIFEKVRVIPVQLKCVFKVLSFGLAVLLKGQKSGKWLMQWSFFWDKDAAVTGLWNPALGEVCADEPMDWGGQQGAEAVLGLPVPALRQSLGLEIAMNFFCVTAVKALISEAASHQHPLDCWNRIKASDWKQMAQAVHEATLCMEQMLRVTSNSAYAHYRYSFILIYSLQKRNSEHKSSNSSSTLPESALT